MNLNFIDMANNTGEKYGGRQKGTPNRMTAETRQMFNDLLKNNIHRIQSDIDELDPIDRIKVIFDLAKFVIPTLKSIEYVETSENTDEVKINIQKLSREQKDVLLKFYDDNGNLINGIFDLSLLNDDELFILRSIHEDKENFACLLR